MSLSRIDRRTVDEFGGEAVLAARVSAFQEALIAHSQTENEPAPVEHPFIVAIAQDGGWSTVEIQEPPPVFREAPTGHRPQDPPPFLPRGVLSLEEFRLTACAVIDYNAELERLKYITPGAGQALEYRETQDEALSWQEGGSAENYPFLFAEVQAVQEALGVEVTVGQVVEEVLNQLGAWKQQGSKIKFLRRSRKLRIQQLDNEEAIMKILDEPWGVSQ